MKRVLDYQPGIDAPGALECHHIVDIDVPKAPSKLEVVIFWPTRVRCKDCEGPPRTSARY